MAKKPVTVAVSGAFDPLHVGHIRYIREAAKLGDRLVVILNSDDFLMKKKGFVFWPFAERKEILEGIKDVAEVVAAVDEDQTVRKTLELIKPDIFAKGGDKTGPETIPETATCARIGCWLVTNVGGGKVHPEAELSSLGRELGTPPAHGVKIACPYCDDHPMLRDKCRYCGGTGKIEVGRAD
ncbi:MAG: adenylyltransferase/cytidyltransferase family protein [Chloroflexi bacterium]|nr:adenylyltransferase/cytidyltransferase family protein [Chloroflexota bacterium]